MFQAESVRGVSPAMGDHLLTGRVLGFNNQNTMLSQTQIKEIILYFCFSPTV